MADIAAIGSVGPGLEGMRLAIEWQARTLKMQADTLEEMGDLALTLIRSATVDPPVGQNLDLQV